jgi:hypothetical protein
MQLGKLAQFAMWMVVPAGLLGAAPPAPPAPAPQPAAAPATAPAAAPATAPAAAPAAAPGEAPAAEAEAPKAPAPAATKGEPGGGEPATPAPADAKSAAEAKGAPEAKAPATPATPEELEAMTPEERLRRAQVDAPGKVCDTPDEAAVKAAAVRLAADTNFQRVAAETTTQATLIAGTYWRDQRIEAERLMHDTVQAWGLPSLTQPDPPDPNPSHVARICKVLTARDPARCRELDQGGDVDFICRAWLVAWNARETGLCAEAPEEMRPLCRIGKEGNTDGCEGATERVQQICRDFNESLTFDWQRCDKVVRSLDCSGMALDLALARGEKACDALGKGAAPGSHRSQLADNCRAILNADPSGCLQAEWKGEGELTPHNPLKPLIPEVGPKVPLPQPVLAPRILGGPSPTLYIFAASKAASICHTNIVVKQEGAEDWSRTINYSVGPHPMVLEPIAMSLSVDPWKAKVSSESLCLPKLVWTRSKRAGRE